MAIREDPIIRSVSALLRLGLMARASFGGKVSSLSSILGWSAGTIIVPLDFRDCRRGRVVKFVVFDGLDSVSEPSDVVVDIEVCFESIGSSVDMVFEGCAMGGTGLIVCCEDDVADDISDSEE